MRIRVLTIILLALGFIGAWYFPTRFGLQSIVDGTPPEIQFHLHPTDKSKIRIVASEKISFISSLNVTASSGDKQSSTNLALPGRVRKYEAIVRTADLIGGLPDGDATLTLTAIDNSYWSNSAKVSTKISIDRVPPKLELLSQQHKMYAGGAELILYQAEDPSLKNSGVKLGDYFFPGKELENGMMAVFIAAPLDMAEEDFKPELFATDDSGNIAKLPLRFQFETKKIPQGKPKLSLAFVERKIPPLVSEAYTQYPDEFQPPGEAPEAEEEWVSLFKLVNEDYRNRLQKELLAILKKSDHPTFITEPMIRPLEGRLMSTFGEERNYLINDLPAGYSKHDGFDLASVKRDKIIASGAGTVRLAKSFGIYGNTVVLDHGYGISSLYGHLTSIDVSVGDTVSMGQVLGNSGETGLAGGDHLHFEIRVGAVPVTPIEWWDKKWFDDNVTGKIEALLQ